MLVVRVLHQVLLAQVVVVVVEQQVLMPTQQTLVTVV
jgi:hypothetical protein